jgi:hypothetical protein
LTVRGEEVQVAGGEHLLQVVQEQSPEHPRQHFDWQEEPGRQAIQFFAVRRDPTAGDKDMNMRVMLEILSPGVQHGDETDLRTQMLRIGGNGAQGFRRPLPRVLGRPEPCACCRWRRA